VLDAVVAAVAQGELPEARLREAADRVRGLADFTGTGEAFPRPEVRIADAFDVQPEAAEALRRTEGWTVVTLDAQPNIAVGAGAWGPAAAAAADPGGPAAFRFATWPAITVPVDRAAPVPEIDGPVLVLGRDVHRRPHARAAVDALRAGGRTVVAVDLGWPSEDRRYADVATFGSSRAVGAALLALLTGTEEPSWRS